MRGPLSVVPEVPLHGCTSIEQSSYLGMPTISIANCISNYPRVGLGAKLTPGTMWITLLFTILSACNLCVSLVPTRDSHRYQGFSESILNFLLRFVEIVQVQCSELNVQIVEHR